MTATRSRAATAVPWARSAELRRACLCAAYAFFAIVHEVRAAAPVDPNAPAATVAAQVCSECHGANGSAPPGEAPNLAGQKTEFLRRQLRAFKSHSRSDEAATANMWPVAHELSERQIDDLAAYFAAQPARAQPTEGSPARIAAGQAIFARGAAAHGVPSCSGCHGRDAAGTAEAPRLAGQHAEYLSRQLSVFQRSNGRPGAAAMRSVAHELTPDAIDDVAAYLQALPHIGAH